MQLSAILLDGDGTLWTGHDATPGAAEFVRRAHAKALRCLLVSNNAGPDRDAYIAKCRRLDLDFAHEDIFSVNHLAGPYLERRFPGARAFVVGSPQFAGSVGSHLTVTTAEEWLAEHATGTVTTPGDLELFDGLQADLVVVGIDVNVSYLKLALACMLVQRGARLVAANLDYTFPYAEGILLPGNGSIAQLIATVCGVEPLVLGKPQPHLLDQIEQETDLLRSGMVMVGDRIETDIAFAAAGGIPGYLVLTGVDSREDAQKSPLNVTVVADLSELAARLGI